MDKKQADKMAAELLAAAQQVAEKYGMIAAPKSGTYTDVSFTARIQFISADPEQNPERVTWAKSYEMACMSSGGFGAIKVEWLGKTFAAPRGNKTFRLLGLNRRATRLPYMAEEVATGKIFKFTRNSILLAFAA